MSTVLLVDIMLCSTTGYTRRIVNDINVILYYLNIIDFLLYPTLVQRTRVIGYVILLYIKYNSDIIVIRNYYSDRMPDPQPPTDPL